MNYVFRCYTEKKPGFNLEARQLFQTLKNGLNIPSLANLRVFSRFDVDEIDFPVYLSAKSEVFADPAQEDLFEDRLPPQDPDTTLLVAQPLPGTDRRAETCAQCLRILSGGKSSPVSCATVYALTGPLTPEELDRARSFLIPAATHEEGDLDKPASLTAEAVPPQEEPPALPLALLPLDGDRALVLTDRPGLPLPFQALHVTGRADPLSAALSAHWTFPRGAAQEFYHPRFSQQPMDCSRFVSLTTQAGGAPVQADWGDLSQLEAFPTAASGDTTIAKIESLLNDPDLASQRGLCEGHEPCPGSVLVPHGGRDQLSPAQADAVLLPGENSDAGLCSLLSAAFHPGFPACASVETMARLVACGCDPAGLCLSGDGRCADLRFALSVLPAEQVLSPEFKGLRHPVCLFLPTASDREGLTALWTRFHALAEQGAVLSAWAVGKGGIADGLMKMSFGNGIGFTLTDSTVDLFRPRFGALIAECTQVPEGALLLGRTAYTPLLELSDCFLSVQDLLDFWQAPSEGAYPTRAATAAKDSDMADIFCPQRSQQTASVSLASPRAVIPVFPGCCGEEAAQACLRAGLLPRLLPLDLSAAHLDQSVSALTAALGESQLLILPGSASPLCGPVDADKLAAVYLRQAPVADAIRALLEQQDGLILGLDQGFRTLVRLGLLPYGEFRPVDDRSVTFTRNLIGRRQSRFVTTRVASLRSPWMLLCGLDEIHTLPVSSAEGRLVVPASLLSGLMEEGQIATQYVDTAGIPSLDISVNPTGATESIEGLFSPDGRVFGKLARSDRAGDALARNIPGYKYQPIFESAARYYQ